MLVGRVQAVEGEVGGLGVVEEGVQGGDGWRMEETGEGEGGGVVEGCVCYYGRDCGQESG